MNVYLDVCVCAHAYMSACSLFFLKQLVEKSSIAHCLLTCARALTTFHAKN